MSTEFSPIFLYLLVAIVIALSMMVASALLGPRKVTRVKQMPYESGMNPFGDARQRFDVRYYLVAIVFLLFDVELLFLYPWAVAFYHDPAMIPTNLHAPVFWEILVFIATLVIAYLYAWRKGVFQWR